MQPASQPPAKHVRRSRSLYALACCTACLACGESTPQDRAEEARDAAAPSARSDGGSMPEADASPAGDPVLLRVYVRNVSSETSATTSTGDPIPVVFSPGLFLLHDGDPPWFEEGQPASPGLRALAEDGSVTLALQEVEARDGDISGFFGADDLGVSYDESPIAPGVTADFVVSARPGSRLELGMMWAQSNDVFVATPPGGIALFEGDAPRTEQLQSELSLWDAGTEVNQEPGLGEYQAARQAAPGSGEREGGVVTRLNDGVDSAGYSYAPLVGTLEVQIVREPE